MGRMISRIYHADVNHNEYTQFRRLGVEYNSDLKICVRTNDSLLSTAQFQIR